MRQLRRPALCDQCPFVRHRMGGEPRHESLAGGEGPDHVPSIAASLCRPSDGRAMQ
jgi:hypothetical protein